MNIAFGPKPLFALVKIIGKHSLVIIVLMALSGCMSTSGFTGEPGVRSLLAATEVETALGHDQPYGFARVSNFARRGERSQRFEVRHGDCGSSPGWNDCDNDRARIERIEIPANTIAGPGNAVWLGFSIFVPSDFQPLRGRAITSVIQTKVKGQDMPVWQMFMNERPVLVYSDDENCRIGSLSSWKGRWNDVTIYANYAASGSDVFFRLYRNGQLLCERRRPIIHSAVVGRPHEINLKYGTYQAFVSRHLTAVGRRPSGLQWYSQRTPSGGRSSSPTSRPFDFDWGVELPTQVIFFDEMLAGPTREGVDVKLREDRGEPPVD